MNDNITPHLPFYAAPPNQLIEYKTQDFDDGYGHQALLRIAVYKNKNGKICEAVAQVEWKAK